MEKVSRSVVRYEPKHGLIVHACMYASILSPYGMYGNRAGRYISRGICVSCLMFLVCRRRGKSKSMEEICSIFILVDSRFDSAIRYSQTGMPLSIVLLLPLNQVSHLRPPLSSLTCELPQRRVKSVGGRYPKCPPNFIDAL